MIDYLYLSLYKLFALLVKILPKRAMDTLLYMIAKFAYRFSRKHNHIINVNLNWFLEDRLSPGIIGDTIGCNVFYNFTFRLLWLWRKEEIYSKEAGF